MPIKVQHVEGFSDNTDYLEIDLLKTVLVTKSSRRQELQWDNGTQKYSFACALRMIEEGAWKEID